MGGQDAGDVSSGRSLDADRGGDAGCRLADLRGHDACVAGNDNAVWSQSLQLGEEVGRQTLWRRDQGDAAHGDSGRAGRDRMGRRLPRREHDNLRAAGTGEGSLCDGNRCCVAISLVDPRDLAALLVHLGGDVGLSTDDGVTLGARLQWGGPRERSSTQHRPGREHGHEAGYARGARAPTHLDQCAIDGSVR